MNASFCWSVICKSPLENVTSEFVFPAQLRMSWMFCEMGVSSCTAAVLRDAASRIYSKQYAALLCSCHLPYPPGVSL